MEMLICACQAFLWMWKMKYKSNRSFEGDVNMKLSKLLPLDYSELKQYFIKVL